MNVYNTNNYKRPEAPSFGQIRPAHLFINSYGYEKNKAWASHVINIIDETKDIIHKNAPFNESMSFVADLYGQFFQKQDNVLKNVLDPSDRLYFGKPRTKAERCVYTIISKKNRYAPYVKKILNKLKNEGKSGVFDNRPAEYFHHSVSDSIFFNKIKLHALIFFKSPMSLLERMALGKYYIKIESPDEKAIPKILKRVEKIYNKILKTKEPISPKSIDKVTKDIAKIHWYLSQSLPYTRGSAGISDAFCKALFESKGIQVSSYKKRIDPNMEAYVRSIDEYAKEYKNFFSSPLSKIK